jgi:uncharacterized protein
VASSFFALFDDIATILDDVSVMTKIAAKKTAGVLGDDLALNAQQVTGVNADRELPVVWAVAKGSAINKLILIPIALALSYFLPFLILPLLMFGGAFLCFEGVEKLAHTFLHSKEENEVHKQKLVNALTDEKVDLVALEKEKIKGAVATDFVLSAEIIVITLGSVNEATPAPFMTQLAVLLLISVIMTVGVYGLVAGIVKLDDAGLHLSKKGSFSKLLGKGILWFAPLLMKTLSIVGTAAMFMVGGGIVAHGIGPVHHFIEGIGHSLDGFLGSLVETALNAFFGILIGIICLLVITSAQKLIKKFKKEESVAH